MSLTIRLWACCAVFCVSGCMGNSDSETLPTNPTAKQSGTTSNSTTQSESAPQAKSESAVPLAELNPVSVVDGTATLTPENSRIEFVGTHAGDKPDPRTCGFAEFSGSAKVDSADSRLDAVSMEIKVDSLFSFNPGLTQHLKSPDFLDSREYPTIKFESSKVETADGKSTITGNLTLMGTTKEVSIPAKISSDSKGLTVVAEFSIDRTEYGMKKMTERVNKDVAIKIVIGEKTDPSSVLPK